MRRCNRSDLRQRRRTRERERFWIESPPKSNKDPDCDVWLPRLEYQLQSHLHLAWTAITQGIPVGHIRGAGNGSESGAVDRHVGQREIGVIQEVEELRTELQLESLVDARRLNNGEVRDVIA